ncbi:T9SS type A sorting domain-containing protein [Flavobacterium sp.]|uniref:T9SS type A sorting domain-containing protein n=1 Tax=Flavobacterium sp. TaxID=239 RepID=UPI00375060BB
MFIINKLLFPVFLIYTTCNAQSFFVNSIIEFPIENKLYELNIFNNTSSPELFVCPATNNPIQSPEQQFLDIALNNNQEIFFISGAGSLYKRQLNNQLSCEFLGSFNTTTNALVADSNNLLYAAANNNGICTLYSYNITLGVFSSIGDLPPNYFSSGDLFFFQNQLFLTGTNSNFTESYVLSINIQNPSLSCLYMNLGSLQPYGAFAINNGVTSSAYILTGNATESSLIEIDMINKTIGNVINNYNFPILGAATFYNLTSNNSECISLEIDNFENNSQFSLQNPVSNNIVILTNLQVTQINRVTLFDNLGKKIKVFSSFEIKNMDVSDVNNGIYTIQISFNNSNNIVRKLIISH